MEQKRTMTSVLGFLITGSVYNWGYRPSRDHANYLHSARNFSSGGTSKAFYFTGRLYNDSPVGFNGLQYIATLKRRYDTFFGGRIGLDGIRFGNEDKLDYEVIEKKGSVKLVNNATSVNIEHLLPLFLAKFGKKFRKGEALDIQLNDLEFTISFRDLNVKLLVPSGVREEEYGLIENGSFFTIVAGGKFIIEENTFVEKFIKHRDGREKWFLVKDEASVSTVVAAAGKVIIEENTSIEELREKADANAAFYRYMTGVLSVITIGLGVLDYKVMSRS